MTTLVKVLIPVIALSTSASLPLQGGITPPVLDLDDLIGTKVRALGDRGLARDAMDVHAARQTRPGQAQGCAPPALDRCHPGRSAVVGLLGHAREAVRRPSQGTAHRRGSCRVRWRASGAT
ncbi:hypothetical protein B6E66_13775 [Streptomyces maremycinicus]|nr:hypothetical protein B6E66_13775 [Streptomyces sp. B9173]